MFEEAEDLEDQLNSNKRKLIIISDDPELTTRQSKLRKLDKTIAEQERDLAISKAARFKLITSAS